MSSTTSRLSLYKPAGDGSEPVNVTTDINDNLEKIDSFMGAVPATSVTPPVTTFNGMLRQNTDTAELQYYKGGSVWTQIWTSGKAFANNALITLGNKIGVGVTSPTAVLDAQVASSSDVFARLKVGAEAQPRIQIESNGIKLGPGSSTVTDVRLYRQTAATLNITGNVVVENNLQVTGTPTFSAGLSITGNVIIDGDTNLNGGADILDHLTYMGYPIMVGQRGTASMAAAAATTSVTTAVTFGRTYPSIPTVVLNWPATATATNGWSARAINITTTGFSVVLQGASSSFSSSVVSWVAFHEGV